MSVQHPPREPYGDIVDFVERTTYEIWNDRPVDLVPRYYGPRSAIWADSASSFGAGVTADSARKQSAYPDQRGVIPTPSGPATTPAPPSSSSTSGSTSPSWCRCWC